MSKVVWMAGRDPFSMRNGMIALAKWLFIFACSRGM